MLNANLYNIILAPIYSEKATLVSEKSKYCFIVSPDATKAQIKEAVEKIFNTTVVKVNVSNVAGKRKVFKGTRGKRPDERKAIVTLEQGKTIDLAAGA